jgi:hypothetical protein
MEGLTIVQAQHVSAGKPSLHSSTQRMDGVAYKDWVQHVVASYAEQHNNRIYLLQDQFSIHISGLHKPFKQYLRELNVAWMVAHGEGEKPTRLDIANWIQVTWDQVSVSTILNT